MLTWFLAVSIAGRESIVCILITRGVHPLCWGCSPLDASALQGRPMRGNGGFIRNAVRTLWRMFAIAAKAGVTSALIAVQSTGPRIEPTVAKAVVMSASQSAQRPLGFIMEKPGIARCGRERSPFIMIRTGINTIVTDRTGRVFSSPLSNQKTLRRALLP